MPKEQQELVNLFKLVKKYANMRTYNDDCKNVKVTIEKHKLTFTFTNGYFLLFNKIFNIQSNMKRPLVVYITPNIFDLFIENSIQTIQYDNLNKCLIIILKNDTKIKMHKNKNEIITNDNVTTFTYSIKKYPNLKKLQDCDVSETHFTFMINVKELINLLSSCESEKMYFHVDIFNQLAPIFLTNNNNETHFLIPRINYQNRYHENNLKIFHWLSKGQIEECKERQKQNTVDTPAEPTYN
jgi:hypothetical protein